MKKKELEVQLEKALKYSSQRVNGINPLFLSSIFINSNFKSLNREIIYVLHILNLVNLKEVDSKDISTEELKYYMFDFIGNSIKIKKNFFYKLTGLSRDTFKKYFNPYLKSLNLHLNEEGKPKRTFTIEESYYILKYWQGDNNWCRWKYYSKQELANIFTKGNYEKLDQKMDSFFTYEDEKHNNGYKNQDKYFPKHFKKLYNQEKIFSNIANVKSEIELNSLLIIYSIFIWDYYKTEVNSEIGVLLLFLFLSRFLFSTEKVLN